MNSDTSLLDSLPFPLLLWLGSLILAKIFEFNLKNLKLERKITIMTYGKTDDYPIIARNYLEKFTTVSETNLKLTSEIPKDLRQNIIIVFNRITTRVEEVQFDALNKLENYCEKTLIVFHLKDRDRLPFSFGDGNELNAREVNLDVQENGLDEQVLKNHLARLLEINPIEKIGFDVIRVLKVFVFLLSVFLISSLIGTLISLMRDEKGIAKFTGGMLRPEALNKEQKERERILEELKLLNEKVSSLEMSEEERRIEAEKMFNNLKNEYIYKFDNWKNKYDEEISKRHRRLEEEQKRIFANLKNIHDEEISQRDKRLEEQQREFEKLEKKYTDLVSTVSSLSEKIDYIKNEQVLQCDRCQYEPPRQ